LPPSWEVTDAGVAGECIVGPALSERELSTRMQHDAFANVNVLRSCWSRGIGRQLAAAIDAWAREQKLRRLTGHVLAHNTRAAVRDGGGIPEGTNLTALRSHRREDGGSRAGGEIL
jgi:GNAT superfamily N-acetyltransferase